ncbi:MAG: hypothetical protein ABJG41_01360 [Cyclobacteriaceae bacterium]
MKLLINKSLEGAQEIQDLTGSYYANNDFERIRTDWLLAQQKITELVGKAVIDRALTHYYSDSYTSPLLGGESGVGSGSASSGLIDVNNELVYALQVPIAYMATLSYYQSNIVGHEDSGRKVKIDNQNEKLPWEWMMDKDDLAQLRKIHQTTDRLIRFLEDNSISEWIEGAKRVLTRKLFVNTVELFQEAYPIDMSPTFFYTVLSFNHEVQTKAIKKALGAQYAPLLAYWQTFADTDNPEAAEGSGVGSGAGSGIEGDAQIDETKQEILEAVQRCIPLLVMIVAVKRLNLQVLPEGVVQTFKSMLQTSSSSQAALLQVIKEWRDMMTEDANTALDDIKLLIQASDPDANTYTLAPTNNEDEKFFQL